MPKLKRYRVKKEILEHLYLQEKLNTKKIGKVVGLCGRTVQILMHEYHIPLRPAGNVGPIIIRGELEKLYLKLRLSSRKIAKIYKCSYSYVDKKIRDYGFPIKTLAAAHITTFRKPFSGNLFERAYLIGFRIGDLRVRKMYKNSETILVDCGSTKPKQITLIRKLFQKYGRVWISKKSKSGKVQIECHLNNSFSFLLKHYRRFPDRLFKNREILLHLLAGFIDAEGSFFICRRDKSSAFSLGNYNLQILRQIKSWLKKEGLNVHLHEGYPKGYIDKQGYIRNGTYWTLRITKKLDLSNFIEIIKPYLRHADRREDSVRVLRNIRQRNIKYGYLGMHG